MTFAEQDKIHEFQCKDVYVGELGTKLNCFRVKALLCHHGQYDPMPVQYDPISHNNALTLKQFCP
jgi:hypothetical protein